MSSVNETPRKSRRQHALGAALIAVLAVLVVQSAVLVAHQWKIDDLQSQQKVPAPSGPPGPAGPPGPEGPAGAPGKDGTDGADGTNGKDGTNGREGRDGTNGRDGRDGQNTVAEPEPSESRPHGGRRTRSGFPRHLVGEEPQEVGPLPVGRPVP